MFSPKKDAKRLFLNDVKLIVLRYSSSCNSEADVSLYYGVHLVLFRFLIEHAFGKQA